MAGQDAIVFLDEVEQNRLGAPLLAWVPLMQRGQEKETAERWVRVCRDKLNDTDRRDAASLAVKFSELTDSDLIWKSVLEPIHMNESKFLRGVRRDVQCDNLMRVLRTKLSGDSLAAALARVAKQDDLAILSHWFDLALTLPPEAILAELDK
jgi:hypothetical protein